MYKSFVNKSNSMFRHKKYILILVLLTSSFHVFSKEVINLDEFKTVLRENVLTQGNWALTQEPITITASFSTRSAGGKHDFFSEGDYWWPNPNDIKGSYIQKDGLTNPENFTDHRKAMIRFSQIVGALASAYIITKNEKYVVHAFKHLNAWFIDTATRMNPSLLYAQAIKGKATGRSIGIIDMIQMLEVAQGTFTMQNAIATNKNQVQKIKEWFSNYLMWVTTHRYGIEERDAKNNHGTCWVMQVAVFAKLVENKAILNDCIARFKTILLPNQMDSAGRFPLELKRTKPYGYSMFNLDAMSTICHVLSDKQENLWDFSLEDGRTLKTAVEFMYPYVDNKESWPYQKDVMYWNEWPIAQPFLVFACEKYKSKNWFNTWKRLNHFPTNEEVIRNVPIRNPLIWL